MRAARVAGGTRPMVEGPCMKFHSRGGGPTTSTVVAVSWYLASRSRYWLAKAGVKLPMYWSSDRKQVGKPSSCTMRRRSSGAPYGLMTTPRAIGFGVEAMAARAGDEDLASKAEAVRPTNCLRFILITIGQREQAIPELRRDRSAGSRQRRGSLGGSAEQKGSSKACTKRQPVFRKVGEIRQASPSEPPIPTCGLQSLLSLSRR